jgi:BBSome-interacting protein of 10 kDa
MSKRQDILKSIIPKSGIVIQEENPYYILCKPKLLPIKSVTFQKLEQINEELKEKAKKQINEDEVV